LEAISDIENFVANITYEEFVKDKKHLTPLFAASKSLEKHPSNFLILSNPNIQNSHGKKLQGCEIN
jgi:hypothetical protein